MLWMGVVLALQASSGLLPEMSQDEAVTLAVITLSVEEKVPVQTINVLRTDPVEWPDTSLGCPQRGESYLHLVTPGFRMILLGGDLIYRVNVGGGLAVICGEGVRLSRHVSPKRRVMTLEPPSPTGEPNDPNLQDLVRQAREDLTKRLEVASDRIELLEAREVTWPDSSLGCPKPDLSYLQVLQDGALIRLREGSKTYEYHSGDSKPPFYCENPSKPTPERK